MIDWNRKLEAVHADGRVLTLDRRDTTKLNDLQWWVSIEGTNILVVGDSGFTGIGWTIRNVVPPTHTYTVRQEDEAALLASDPLSRSTPTPDERAVAPELVARLVELARSVATSPACTIAQTVEAQNILAALEPVDEDLVIARQMAAKEACKHHDHYVIVPTKDGVGQRVWGASAAAMILDGQADDSPAVSGRLAALARGRQLEKEGK